MLSFSITTLSAQSQYEMNNDALNSYKKVDNELTNKVKLKKALIIYVSTAFESQV